MRLATRFEEAAEPGAISWTRTQTLLNGGRPREARQFLPDDSSPEHLTDAINYALYWGGDSAAAVDAARGLNPLAATGLLPGEPRWNQVQAMCALGAWHAGHSDYRSVETAIKKLRVARRHRRVHE